VLRVFLFALPMLCLFTAYCFFPFLSDDRPVRRRWHAFLALAVCALVFVGGFFLTRYGNERYERIRTGEMMALDHIYRDRSNPIRILWLTETPSTDATPTMLNSYRDLERVLYVAGPAPRDARSVSDVVDTLRDLGPNAYLITARSQEAYLETVSAYPADWGDQFREHMAATPGVRVEKENADAVVYSLADVGDANTTASPKSSGSPPGGTPRSMTPLTPVGVVSVASLLIILVIREIWRLRLPAGSHQRLRPLTLASIPLLIALLVVVGERFAVLS
jgi:hypothetical protein